MNESSHHTFLREIRWMNLCRNAISFGDEFDFSAEFTSLMNEEAMVAWYRDQALAVPFSKHCTMCTIFISRAHQQ